MKISIQYLFNLLVFFFITNVTLAQSFCVQVANNDQLVAVDNNRPMTFSLGALLGNDAANLGLASFTQPTSGMLSYNETSRMFTYTPTSGSSGLITFNYTLKREIETRLGPPIMVNGEEHFFEVLTSAVPITWTEAKMLAENRSYNGLKGYLATITTTAENNFLATKTQQTWLGGSDEGQEGNWRWVTGPETNMPFAYTNWAPGEPNNAGGPNGDENYLAFISGGRWNDINEAPSLFNVTNYVVEYGSAQNCEAGLTATVSITVNNTNQPNSPDLQPFAFTEFKGTLINNNSEFELTWKVNNDENTASYVIQKSADGANFTRLVNIPRYVHNFPAGTFFYQFNDKYLFPGTNYYRIMRVGNDGSVTYSNIISVTVQFAFIEFRANPVSNTELALLWRVVNEANTVSYDIERSMDGMNFTRIGSLPRFMHYLPAREFTYQFNDKNMLSGTNYYRIRQMASNGTMTYSSIISYNTVTRTMTMMAAGKQPNHETYLPAAKELLVYPNPAKERAQVAFTLTQAGAYSLALYDLKGALVKTVATGKAQANQSLSHDLEVSSYAKGVYLLKLVSDKQVSTQRIVIQD